MSPLRRLTMRSPLSSASELDCCLLWGWRPLLLRWPSRQPTLRRSNPSTHSTTDEAGVAYTVAGGHPFQNSIIRIHPQRRRYRQRIRRAATSSCRRGSSEIPLRLPLVPWSGELKLERPQPVPAKPGYGEGHAFVIDNVSARLGFSRSVLDQHSSKRYPVSPLQVILHPRTDSYASRSRPRDCAPSRTRGHQSQLLRLRRHRLKSSAGSSA